MARRRVARTLRNRATNGSNRANRRLKKRGFRQIKKAKKKANSVLDAGIDIGKQLTPELFEGGSGLDRTDFQAVTPSKVDFNAINKYLTPSVGDASQLRDTTRSQFEEVLDQRRAALGGLDAQENQALKDSLYRDIDRQRAGALRDVDRTAGLGAGASFAQRRALNRDYGNQSGQASRQLLLDNVNIKRQAAQDFEGSATARANAVGSANQSLAGIRELQGQFRQGVDRFNVSNQFNADQVNSQNKLISDQFNAGQQGKEIAGRVGAIATGTGLLGDERSQIQAQKKKKELLAFLRERDANLFNQAQRLF